MRSPDDKAPQLAEQLPAMAEPSLPGISITHKRRRGWLVGGVLVALCRAVLVHTPTSSGVASSRLLGQCNPRSAPAEAIIWSLLKLSNPVCV